MTALWLLKQGADPNASEEKYSLGVWERLRNVALLRNEKLARNYPLSMAMALPQQNSKLDFGHLSKVYDAAHPRARRK